MKSIQGPRQRPKDQRGALLLRTQLPKFYIRVTYDGQKAVHNHRQEAERGNSEHKQGEIQEEAAVDSAVAQADGDD